MPRFSKISSARLATCHADLILLFNVVVKYFDCKILYGARTPEKQFKLFQIGREKVGGTWKKVGQTVTNCDGYSKPSDHNFKPSRAVDAVPYPVDYKNTRRQIYFIGYVLGVARILKRANKIKHEVRSGVDWNADTYIKDTRFLDFPHFYIYI